MASRAISPAATALVHARGLAPLVGVLACGTAEREAQGDRDDAIATLAFADGARVRVLAIAPDPVEPGAAVTVTLAASEGVGALVVGLWPPQVGGRELVLGSGVDAELAARTPDERSVFAEVRPAGVDVDATLTVPSPWSPRTAILTVARPSGGDMLPVVAGPRTRDGLGLAGLVHVVDRPPVVVAQRSAAALQIDGVLDEPVWSGARWYPLGDSLEGEPAGPTTAAALAWDDSALYVAVRAQDDDVWSDYTARDEPLWKQEAIELFLFGDASRRGYLELQVSPRGVQFDARFAQYRKGDEAWNGRWQAAVQIDGTVDRRDDRDRGLTAEFAVPFAEICEHTASHCPPQAGDRMRANVFRLDRPRRANPIALSLAPTRVTDFHAPEHSAIVELAP